MNTYQVIFVDTVNGSRTLRFNATSIEDAIRQSYQLMPSSSYVGGSVVSITATKL